MFVYDTVVDAINGLKKRGYTVDFNLAFDNVLCAENNLCFLPEDFVITEVHRFEGDTSPSDEDIVYALESRDGNIKGILNGAFGLYDNDHSEIIAKLTAKEKIISTVP